MSVASAHRPSDAAPGKKVARRWRGPLFITRAYSSSSTVNSSFSGSKAFSSS